MIKGPSNQGRYTIYFSGDPAFVQLKEDATPEEAKEYFEKLEHARETGNYSLLRLEGGGEPTGFVMRPMQGQAARELGVRNNQGVAISKLTPLAFRACIVKVDGDDYPVKPMHDPDLGDIATVDITNALDSVSPQIVNELGLYLMKRGCQGLHPKS